VPAALYLTGLAPVAALEVVAPWVPALAPYPFLPLLVVSTYCAVGVVAVWVQLQWLTWAVPDLLDDPTPTKRKQA
jgi:hypothetical protein